MGLGRPLACALLGLGLASSLAQAGEQSDFDLALANAWAQGRDALYQSAPGRAQEGATREAVANFLAAWEPLVDRWAEQPPPRYAEDHDFGQELAAISDIAQQARQRARQGRIVQAHAVLQQIPALLGEMRRRNGVAAYTDELDAFGEQLAEAADDPFEQPELSPAEVVTLIKQVGVLSYLGERMEKRAPSHLAEDKSFLDLAEAINGQLRALEVAVLAGQRAPVVAVLADLRQAFDQLYLLYG